MIRALIFGLAVCALPVSAASGEITCYAEQFVTTDDGPKDYIRQNLELEYQDSRTVIYSTEINSRAYVLAGDPISGKYYATQSWGPGYTFGIMSVAAFDSENRFTLAQVEQTVVHKLVCTKE